MQCQLSMSHLHPLLLQRLCRLAALGRQASEASTPGGLSLASVMQGLQQYSQQVPVGLPLG